LQRKNLRIVLSVSEQCLLSVSTTVIALGLNVTNINQCIDDIACSESITQ